MNFKKRFVSILVCFMMIAAIFPISTFSSVVFAVGTANVRICNEGYAMDGNFDLADTINFYFYSSLSLSRGKSFYIKDHFWMDDDYFLNFTHDVFEGKTINIIGEGKDKAVLSVKPGMGFLAARNCVVNLKNVILTPASGSMDHSFIRLGGKDLSRGGKSRLNMINSEIVGCKNHHKDNYDTITHSGGAIAASSTIMTMENSSISDCKADTGGAIYCPSSELILKGRSKITNCHAKKGGAIYQEKYKLNISGGVTISNCSADFGGAIYAYDMSEFNFDGSTISNCKASQHGAAVYERLGNKFKSSGGAVISNCSAGQDDGAIYVEPSIYDRDDSSSSCVCF